MEFGYSSSAASSPDPQAFAVPLIYDGTTESSTPTSPEEVQQMLGHATIAGYDMFSYQDRISSYYASEAQKMPVQSTQSNQPDSADRRKRRSSSDSKDKENTTNMHLRRRAQNRASQRAFRERKERHLKGLEHQLGNLHEKHQELLQSYTRQADQVSKLNARIAELVSEVEMLRSSSATTFGEMMMPDKFDAVPGSTMLYPGPDFYFDKGVIDMAPKLSQKDELL